MTRLKRLLTVLLAVACLMTGLTAYAAESTGFYDVDTDAWYADAVVYVQENLLMSGTSTTTFQPNTNMSRAMLATVLHRAEGTPTVSNSAGFTDVVSGSWYANGVNWAAENNIVSGYGGGAFGTNDPVTREQISTILWRYAGQPAIEGSVEVFADESSISSWALDAVHWVRSVGIVSGKTGNRFDPKANATRAEVATMLRNYLTQEPSDNSDVPSNENHVLVVYFSLPETSDPNNMTAEEANSTVVIDGEVLGNTQYMAYVIQENTSADIFRIEPETPYPLDHNTLVDQASDEQNRNLRPAIKAQVENVEQYDVIFLGYPTWWGDMPMILYTFLGEYDLSGKTIVPFNTHGGSGFSNTISTIARLQPNAEVLSDGLSISRNSIQDTETEIIAWLNELDILN